MPRRFSIVAFLAVCLLFVQSAPAAGPRFSALLSDGTHLEGNVLSDWQSAGLVPKLDAQPLLAPSNAMRWLRDRSLSPPSTPSAYIEMIGGDRLPGEVTAYNPGVESSYEPQPAHFVVKTDVTLRPPTAIKEPVIRVLQRFVRRVVWKRRTQDRYQPATVFYRDGREISFRSVRFNRESIDLLLADGLRKVFFNEIAELHMPQADAWSSYYDELAMLGVGDKTRLIQLETTEGLAVTATLARMRFSVQGNSSDFTRWIHGLHPAWSLETLWIPNANVWIRRLFAPHEVPLTRVHPVKSRQRSPLSGTGWSWRHNRNAHGGALFGGKQDVGWGFGVHALSELYFELPTCVVSFRSGVGLDRLAGRGGCVRARAFADSIDAPPLYQSPFLVGSDTTADTGAIALKGPAGGQKQLILQVDPAHAGRPAGADPLDIRDFADWINPILTLDPVKLKAEITLREPKLVPAWKGWTLSVDEGAAIEWTSTWDELSAAPGSFSRGAIAKTKPFSVQREMELSAADRWLIVAVSSSVSSAVKPKIEIHIDDQKVMDYEVPMRNRSVPSVAPLSISLADYHAAGIKKIKFEIRQMPLDGVPIQWRALQITSQMPTLYQLFEDEGDFVAVEEEQKGVATIEREDRHSGNASIKITPDGAFRMLRNSEKKIRIRQSPAWGEYRYLRFAFRKYGEGRISLELNHDNSEEKPVRYDAGLGEPSFGKAVRVWVQRLPSQWIVMTRDLYAEFGEMDATGLTLNTLDGDYALFDHVYLARAKADFDSIPKAPSVELTNQKARRELAKPILDKASAVTVGIDYGDGRVATGAIVSAEGHILTAGHTVIAPDREVIVHLPDGQKLKGKTLGIFRTLDLGMIKVESEKPLPFVEISTAAQVPSELLYVALSLQNVFPKEGPAEPHAHIASIRRVFRGMVWTDFDVKDWSAGGPLVGNDGKLLGIHTRRSRFGGFLYARLASIQPHLEKLKSGEVWGTWSSDSGPTIGLSIAADKKGCKVLKAGADDGDIKPGDIIRRVNGRSVVSENDIVALTADLDPGQQIDLEILRDGKSLKGKLTLLPRVP